MRIHESHKMSPKPIGEEIWEDMCLNCEATTLIHLVRSCWADVGVFINSQILSEVAKRTGLTEQSCQDLLDRGWTYIETINCLPRWERQVY